MAQNSKLGKNTTQRIALIKNQVSDLFWYGKIETTLVRAKAVAAKAEKLLTLAIKTYADEITDVKETVDAKGVKIKKEVIKDGITRLNARRKIMASVYDLQEQREPKETKASFKDRTKDIEHPIVEKIFRVYAPKYDKRAKELNIAGGYTRITRKTIRRGDNAEIVILELI